MVGIDKDTGIFKSALHIDIVQMYQIFVVVVGAALAEIINVAAQNRVGIRITVGLDFPASVEEGMTTLGSYDTVHHNGEVTTGRVLHADRNTDTAGGQTMLLVLYGTGTDRCVGQDIGDITVIFRVKKLVGTGQAGFTDRTGMQITDLDQTLKHIRSLIRIGLVHQTFVTGAGGTRFVCIDTRDNKKLVLDLLLHFGETVGIIKYRIPDPGDR